jgi:ankyrin repeat protein
MTPEDKQEWERIIILGPQDMNSSIIRHINDLITSGRVDINMKDEERDDEGGSRTPLMYTLDMENYELAHILLNAGANVNLQSDNGETALMIAVDTSATRKAASRILVLEHLLQKGANPNLLNNKGATALILTLKYPGERVSRNAVFSIVRSLIEYGADPTVKDLEGNTVLSLAIEHNLSDIAEYIRSSMPKPIFNLKKKRQTSDWMEICNDFTKNYRVQELRQIIINHVNQSNIRQLANYFGFNIESSNNVLNEFEEYVNSLRKRELCIALAKYYTDTKENIEANQRVYKHNIDCQNTQTLIGLEELSSIPPERLIILKQSGKLYCFDALEFVDLTVNENPYTRTTIPINLFNRMMTNAKQKVSQIPTDIHELKERGSLLLMLLNEAEDRIDYFPRKNFLRLGRPSLLPLAENLAQVDPNFNLDVFKNQLNQGLNFGRAYILRRIINTPSSNVILNEYLEQRFH